MVFAALHPEAGRIDATLDDLGCGLSWAAVHKARPGAALRCPDCGHGSTPRSPPAGCGTSPTILAARKTARGSMLEHHLLKLELATAIRAADWHAELEVRAPGGSWRADVLASAHDGSRRVAFEAQLSPITDDDITARTSRYRADGIDLCWVSAGRWPPWMETVP
jgi:hypothetical protein